MMNKAFRDFLRSLSFRLSFLTTVLVFSLILTFWFFLYTGLKNEVELEDRESIEDRIRTIRSLLGNENESPQRLTRRVELEWATHKFERLYVRIVTDSGKLITETPGISPELSQAFITMGSKTRGTQNLEPLSTLDINDITFKMSRAHISIENGKTYNYVVDIALDRTAESLLLKRFRQSFLFVIVFGFLACLIVARVLVRQSLRSIQEISSIVCGVSLASLKDRVGLLDLPIEFHQLAMTMNDMLERLEKSFAQLSRFSDDMAHELRTPINNMLGVMSLALTKSRKANEYTAVLASAVEDCERIKRIVESLLFIARAADPKTEVKKEVLTLREEVLGLIEFYEPSASLQAISIRLQMIDDFKIEAERTLFQRAISNLLSNAIRHSPNNSQIVISILQKGNRVSISIVDSGDGIRNELIQNIGERFFRIDDSRSKAEGGTGLGLSIVKSIVQIHGGKLEIQNQDPHGLRVSLDFACIPQDEQIVIINS